MVVALVRRTWLGAALCSALAACGGGDPAAPAPDGKRAVSGVVMKGAVQGATVKFYEINDDGTANPDALVATVNTDSNGTFITALPTSSVHLLAQTFDGSFEDEADPAATGRRRIALPASPTVGFEAVLPPGATTLAITPYSHAMLIKARLQAGGTNFANVFDAVRAQATTAFGFDPITTVPANPLSPTSSDPLPAVKYALLVGAAAQSINTIATTAGHLPDFNDVMLFVNDLGDDGNFDLVELEEQLRRFRNNNFDAYRGLTALPVVDEALLSLPAEPGGEGAVLPYLTNSGELRLFDPADPANPALVASGLSTTTFDWRTLMKATVSASVASNITPARLVYISGGVVKKVSLEPGQSRVPVQVSNITNACRINGIAEDFTNPDNSIVRIDTAGTNGVCENGSGDDFTTAQAWLVPLSTAPTGSGIDVGFGHCCGVTGIGDASGNLTGVLVAEDDGSGSTFFVRRRDVGSLTTPTFSASFEIAGTGQTYGALARGLGDQHIYVRGRPAGSTTYKLVRFNVAGNSFTEVHDFGVSDASAFEDAFDHNTFDATRAYFTSADGSALLAVAHAATGPGSATPLVTLSPGDKIVHVEHAGDRLVFEVDAGDGIGGGISSVLKAGGGVVQLAADDAFPTFYALRGASGSRVFIDRIAGSASPAYTAFAVNADGTSVSSNITDAQWAGETFATTCDFSLSCEDSVGTFALFLRRQASTSTAQIELAVPATGAPTGTYLGSIAGVFDGPAVFAVGFGQYAQFTAFAATSQTTLYLGDSAQASATPPSTALLPVATASGGDHRWLLFEDGGDDGGSSTQDSDGDGLTDAEEAALGTNPASADTDGDGLGDFDELSNDGDPTTYLAGVDTDPTNPDTDGDGVGDGAETSVGSDPLSPNLVRFVDPNAGCSAACDGLTWATAWPDESFVEGANEFSGTGTGSEAYVLFAPGIYGSLDLTGVDREHVVYIGSLGPGIYAPAFPPSTVFDGAATTRALHVTQSAALGLSHMRFQNGFDTALGGGVLLAAPVHSALSQNTVTLERVEIVSNVSGQSGGGIVASGTGNTLSVEAAFVGSNQAQGSSATLVQGGGVLALNGAQVTVLDSVIADNSVTCANAGCTALGAGGAASGTNALLDVQASIVENNSASTSSGAAVAGGGLSADTAAALFVSDVEVRDNSVSAFASALGAGGGIAAIDATLSTVDSVIRGNTATAITVSPPFGGGGGLYAESNATVTLLGSILADNKAAAGPGGGANLVGAADVLVEDNKFLANGSLNPGGGLHIHPGATAASTSVFNNLFVGNAASDSVAEGGAVEIDIDTATGAVSFESNTVAYNQTTAASGAGGGVAIKAGVTASMALNNNNVWFNQDNTPLAANAGDNYLDGGPPLTVAASGNNVNEASLTGGNLSPALDPLFVQGFYLSQGTSPSVDVGDDAFAGPLTTGGYTTDPGNTSDSPAVDIGFHHTLGSVGSFDSVALTPSRGLSCASFDTIIFTPTLDRSPQGEPGHLIVVELSGVTPTLGSLTTLDPRASGSRVARDLGDGRYAVDTSGFHSGSATGTFTVYADDQATPRTFTLTFTNAC